ncbi:MAG: DUF2935 domain-containing protein [Bacillota bacterium]
MLSLIEEIRFWTGIMRDHGEFILSSLSHNEQEAIHFARLYKETFSRLHERSKSLTGVNSINTANSILNESMNVLLCFINFKKILLGRLLKCQLNTSLPPTFYNHMINEAMEFYETLINIQCNKPVNPLLENLDLHKIWLPDASGHAASIAGDLDPTEQMLINEAQEFEKCFNCLTLKAQELGKMLTRTCIDDGALKRLNEEVKMKIGEFIGFLDNIKELRVECKVLGVLKPLIPDHMIREEKYYLNKIAAYE